MNLFVKFTIYNSRRNLVQLNLDINKIWLQYALLDSCFIKIMFVCIIYCLPGIVYQVWNCGIGNVAGRSINFILVFITKSRTRSIMFRLYMIFFLGLVRTAWRCIHNFHLILVSRKFTSRFSCIGLICPCELIDEVWAYVATPPTNNNKRAVNGSVHSLQVSSTS